MSADPFRFTHALRVRWGECDMQGIVFNPHYLMYCDVAFTEYWREIGLIYPDDLAALGLDNFMVAAALRFRASARYDDTLAIAVRTAQFGRTSFGVSFEIRRDGASLVGVDATYVIGDRATQTPRLLPDVLRARVLAFEAVPPAEKAQQP